MPLPCIETPLLLVFPWSWCTSLTQSQPTLSLLNWLKSTVQINSDFRDRLIASIIYMKKKIELLIGITLNNHITQLCHVSPGTPILKKKKTLQCLTSSLFVSLSSKSFLTGKTQVILETTYSKVCQSDGQPAVLFSDEPSDWPTFIIKCIQNQPSFNFSVSWNSPSLYLKPF